MTEGCYTVMHIRFCNMNARYSLQVIQSWQHQTAVLLAAGKRICFLQLPRFLLAQWCLLQLPHAVPSTAL